MIIIVCVGLALVELYFWLIGHWFARVVAALVLVPLLGLGVAAIFTGGGSLPTQAANVLAGSVGMICGVAAAWFIAGAPTCYWRRKSLAIARAMAVR